MSYKIVVDSCCDLPEELKHDPRYEIVPLTLIVGDSYERLDDDGFDQKEFLQAVAECPVSPRSACPSPEKYMEAYRTDADHVYVVTLSSKLSGSYNSAVLGKNLYHETYGEKQIYVVDSRSASCGETQIAMQIARWEDEGMGYEEITEKIEKFTDGMHTYFVLDNLDTLRKNGRLSGVKALVASTLSIKPVMAGDQGSIVQLGQSVGIKKALAKMVDHVVRDVVDAEKKCLMITHCNNPERANSVKEQILSKVKFKDVLIMDTAGISSMYANDGGVIVTA
ncbi:MAG: dihydroxyacetone kinase [Roseburia sp. CAG:10041_57]|nr:MAG: dihydroxyacetone kinase [Roseburia sp. CAG:10041_57]